MKVLAVRKAIGFVAALADICVCGTAAGATWYVDESVSVSGDGRSWVTAFKKIHGGIDAASDGDSVVSGYSANHDGARASLEPTDKGHSLLCVQTT